MITFPLSNHASLIVIEPANIAKMKEGKPLKVGEHLVCFTPDMQKFIVALGVDLNVNIKPGERIEQTVKLTPEQLQLALYSCQNLPEVLR